MTIDHLFRIELDNYLYFAAVVVFSILLFTLFRVFLCGVLYSLFPFYSKLDKVHRLWCDQIMISTIHAFVIGPAMYYYYFTVDGFFVESSFFHRHLGVASLTAFSLGYFIFDSYDVVVGLRYALFPHHIVSIVSCYLVVHTQCYHLGAIACLSMELTTPFVNWVQFLRATRQKESKYYPVAIIVLLVMWFVFRLGTGIGGVIYILYRNQGEIPLEWERARALLTWWAFLWFTYSVLNIYWFYKVIVLYMRTRKPRKKKE